MASDKNIFKCFSLYQNSKNQMCCLAKQKSNKANLSNLYPRQRVILETLINTNIDPISPTPKFTFGRGGRGSACKIFATMLLKSCFQGGGGYAGKIFKISM